MHCFGSASFRQDKMQAVPRRAFVDKAFSNIGTQKPMKCRAPVGLQMSESCAGVAETTIWTLNPRRRTLPLAVEVDETLGMPIVHNARRPTLLIAAFWNHS
jgi:hypothetical protein